mmetsp:Transcript_15097/g.23898  ORF Transcript_15097/g.23898 Transcript_15097/m.23898 type:complete len:219 (-) Transcript_15097:805-1461(-)
MVSRFAVVALLLSGLVAVTKAGRSRQDLQTARLRGAWLPSGFRKFRSVETVEPLGSVGIRRQSIESLEGGLRQTSRLSILQGRCKGTENAASESVEDTAKKYGLEAGLFKAMKSGGDAKSLLKKYGGAYLATSTSLAALSFALCYLLVDNGVDVPGLLSKIGIETTAGTTKAGTAAIAYAAHKAASPIRFPPTVVLTPIVAEKIFGRKENATEAESTT